MKKFLSVLLAVMMVLSTVSFAAPSLVSVADTAVEAPAEVAELASAIDEDVNYIANYEFNTDTTPFAASIDGTSGANTGHFRGAVISQVTKDGVGAVKVALNSTNFATNKYGDINTNSAIVAVAAPGELQNIQVRFKVEGYTFAEGSAPKIRFHPWFDGAVSTANGFCPGVTTIDKDGWYVYDANSYGNSLANFTSGNLTNVQFGFEGVTNSGPSYDANTVFYIDYIRFVGLPTQNLVLDRSGFGLADQTIEVTSATTVAGALAAVNFPVGAYKPKALKTTEGVVLESTAKVADYDELVVVWQKHDTFGFDFDTEAPLQSKVNGNGTYFTYDRQTTEGGRTYATYTNEDYVPTEDKPTTSNQHRLNFANLGIPAGELEGFYITLRMPSDSTKYTGLPIVWNGADGTKRGQSSVSGAIVPVSASYTAGDWVTLYYDASKISNTWSAVGNQDGATLKETGLKSMRFDLDTDLHLCSVTAVDVDEILFIGKPVNETTLVMDPATAPSEKASYTKDVVFDANTTAAKLVSEVDVSGYDGTKIPAAIKIGGNLYKGDDVVGNLIANGDEVTVVWASINLIAPYSYDFSTKDDFDRLYAAYGSDGALHNNRLGTTLDKFVTYSNDGYVSFNVIADDSLITTATSYGGVAGARDAFLFIPGLGNTNSNAKSWVQPSDLNKLTIKMRYIVDTSAFDSDVETIYRPGDASDKGVAFNKTSFVAPNYFYGTNGATLGKTDGEQKSVNYQNLSVTAASEWFTVELTPANFGNKPLSSFRLGYNLPTGSRIDIAYIRFIGYSTEKVTVDAGELGMINATYTATTTVKQLLDSLEYPIGAKMVTGIVGAEETDLVADVVENGTLTAVLDDNVWLGEYGVKVFSVDFDNAESITSGITLAELGAEFNPLFNASSDATFTIGSATGFAIVDDNGDKYMTFGNGASSSSGMFYINNGDSNPFSRDDGHYVFTFDTLSPDELPATVVFNKNTNDIEENQHSYDGVNVGEWDTFVAYYPKNERYSNGAGAKYIDSIAEVTLLKFQNNSEIEAGTTMAMDNLTLWWLPKSVDVTVDVGTANAEADDATFTISTAETTAGDLAAKIYGGKKTVAGLALTAGGAALDADKPLVLTGDTTLYVTGWDDISYLAEWGAEFDTDTGYSYKTFTHGLTNPTDDTSSDFYGFESTDYVDYYGSYVYGANNENGEDYIKWNDDGYITLIYDVSDAYKTAAGDNTPVIYDSVLYINGLDNTPGSHVDSGSFVKAGSVNAIQFRYRYTGDIVAKGDAVYSKGAAATATEAFAPYLHVWSSGESAKRYNVLPEITTSGEWVIATVAAADIKIDVNDLYVLRLDLPDCMPAGATFDVDYIRFLGDTAEAPTTLSAATALRENKAGEDYANAIRFMATVNAVTKTRATDIGWLVSTKAHLGTDELTYDKYVAGSNKVKVAYQKQNGADAIANYFNTEDDDANVFAAFLYNIPEKNALDDVVVRPFVKSGSKYLYGEAVTTNLYTMLNIDAYIVVNTEYYPNFEAIVAEGGWTYDELVDYEVLSYNDAYTALDDAEKQAYITAVLTALLG